MFLQSENSRFSLKTEIAYNDIAIYVVLKLFLPYK